MPSSAELDRDVCLHVYERFLDEGRPPTHAETASALGMADDEAATSYARLAEQRVLVLASGTR